MSESDELAFKSRTELCRVIQRLFNESGYVSIVFDPGRKLPPLHHQPDRYPKRVTLWADMLYIDKQHKVPRVKLRAITRGSFPGLTFDIDIECLTKIDLVRIAREAIDVCYPAFVVNPAHGCVTPAQELKEARDCLAVKRENNRALRENNLALRENNLALLAKNRKLRAALEAAEAELATLRHWKEQALEVSAGWDVQRVGELLRLPVGTDIHPQIESGIRALLLQRDKLQVVLSQMASQKLESEWDRAEDDAWKDLDFEGAYETLVTLARTALKETPIIRD